MSRTVSADFRLPYALRSDGSISTIQAGRIPTVYWPDGRLCFAVNAFLLDMTLRNKSTLGNGGTIKTYASELSHLVRYCYSNSLDFLDLTDNDFSDFVFSLSEPSRNSTTVLRISRLALSFLEFLGNLFDDETFVGMHGRIKAERKFRVDRRMNRSTRVWVHRSFPNPSPIANRRPIGGAAIESLRVAAVDSSESTFIRTRRLITILMLECTGGRRSEVVGIRVADIKRALRSGQSMLSVPSIKKGGNRQEVREIPVSRSDLDVIDQYVEVNRRTLIRQTCGSAQDLGHLLVSSRNGQPLSGSYITHEIWKLARQAGLECAASPHLFRHRFITKIFIAMKKYRDLKTADAFTRALNNDLAFQRKLMEWSGHRSPHSLLPYIDLAFDEDEVTDFTRQYLVSR